MIKSATGCREWTRAKGHSKALRLGIAYYFKVMDEMQEEVLVMYQEVKSLTKDALPYVLKKEMEMVGMFETLIRRCEENGELEIDANHIQMLAHNIFVQGQMWGFRRWALRKQWTIEEYISIQTDLLFSGIKGYKKAVGTGGKR